MRNNIIMLLSFLIISGKVYSAEIKKNVPADAEHTETIHQKNTNLVQFTQLEHQVREDFRLFLEELYAERERGKKESEQIAEGMHKTLEDTKKLITESRKEIVMISNSETRNLLIASIFLWISITVFIIMNLIFGNNIKKELYFLRNGLLRSEIKDTMISLSNQLNALNERLNSTN